MGNTIEEEIIKSRNPVHINNLTLILKFILVTSLIIIVSYPYTDYYETIGVVEQINYEYYLKITVPQDISLSNDLEVVIDKKNYSYKLYEFDPNLYIDDNMTNYRYTYLKIDLPDEYNITNYLLEIKVPIKKQTIIKYLKEILGGN
jgi:hypothetical protein